MNFYRRPWSDSSSRRRLLWWPPTFPTPRPLYCWSKPTSVAPARWRPTVMQPDVSSDKARLCLTAMKWVIKACLSKLIYCTLFISMSRGPLCLSDVVFWAGFSPPASCRRRKASTSSVRNDSPRGAVLYHYGYATYRKSITLSLCSKLRVFDLLVLIMCPKLRQWPKC